MVLFFAFVFLGIIATAHAADENTTQTVLPSTDNQDELEIPTFDDTVSFTTDPAADKITNSTPKVTFTFKNLDPDKNYTYCTGSKYCFLGLDSTSPGIIQVPEFILGGKNKSNVGKPTNGELKFDVCPQTTLAIVTLAKPCNDVKAGITLGNNTSLFAPGRFYIFSLGTTAGTDSIAVFTPQTLAFFYVPHAFPKVSIEPKENVTTPATVKVTIDPKNKEGKDVFLATGTDAEPKLNNYQVSMVGGTGYNGVGCVGWNSANRTTPLNVTFNNLDKGSYSVYIREQINESGLASAQFAGPSTTALDISKPYQTPLGRIPGSDELKGCEGGFVYYKANCVITDPKANPKGRCTKFIQDPKGDEYKQFLDGLNELNKVSKVTKLPCGSGKTSEISTNCLKVDTAIGPVDVSTPQAFIKTIFQFALVIAAFGGVILIIVSGYILMTSSGNKEKVKGAGEMLSSAIVGLLFIILSIVILEIIGVDLLRLPGFGR